MIRALLALCPLILISSTGCTLRCDRLLDCGEGAFCEIGSGRCQTECFADIDCRESGRGFRCVESQGRCVGFSNPPDPDAPPIPELSPDWDGYNATPNTGKTFIISQLQVASDLESALNVDDKCTASTCGDNALGRASSFLNGPLANGVASGSSLIVVEIAGLEEEEVDFDLVTIKIYGAFDADDRLNNNFRQPPNDSSPCCTFDLDGESLPGNQASARIRARIERGFIRPLEHNDTVFTLALGQPPHRQLHFKRAQIQGRFARDGIHGAVLGGAVPMSDLSREKADPFCSRVGGGCAVEELVEGSVLDLLTAVIGQPDMDLDGDGVECVLRTGGGATVDACCDGNGAVSCLTPAGTCAAATVPPSDPLRPSSCAEQSAIVDGYSVALAFDAVPAVVIGVR